MTKKNRLFFGLALIYYVITATIYAVMSVVKHNHYQTAGDLCVFNQGIWLYSRLKLPFVTYHINHLFLSDHFHPILIALAPFYWLYPNERFLLIIQPFILLSAIVPLFLIALRQTKSWFFSLAIIFSYSLYLPIQYTIFFDFHEIIFFPPLFAWMYYFYLKDKRILVNIFLILILLTKEELGFLVSAFGLYLLLFSKGWKKPGLFWLISGIVYSIVIIYFVIPALGEKFRYLNYGAAGNSPLGLMVNMVKDPITFFNLLYNSPLKQDTLFKTFYPFGFLPLLSPLGLILSLEQFASRFFDLQTTNRWTIYYHYSAPMAVIGSLGTILTTSFILKKFPQYAKFIVIFIAVALIFLTRIEQINNSAVLLGKRPEFWQTEQWMKNLDQAITYIDPGKSVSSDKNIACHLSNREQGYFLDGKRDTDYILSRFDESQLEAMFTFYPERGYRLNNYKGDNFYRIVFQKGDVYLFQRD